MPSVYNTLYNWARKTSSFQELRFVPSHRGEAASEVDNLIYRLKCWPELSDSNRTADVFRALSVMSHRPINRHWILTHSKLRAAQVDKLLQKLVAQDAVEVIDGSKFAIA